MPRIPLLHPPAPARASRSGRTASVLLGSVLLAGGALSQRATPAPPHPAPQKSPELRALLDGRLNDAIPALEHAISEQPAPEAQLLLCRALFSEHQFDDALPLCQAAADAPGAPSSAFLWLGRVEGERARHANPLSAFGLARKAKAAFSKAVELDGANGDAVRDLGEYLVQAPGVVGGGLDQAHALAQRVMATAPSAAHRTLALAAAKSDDPATAEQEYRAAIASARPAELSGAWVDLARFQQQRGDTAGATAAIQSALAADRPPSPATVDAARTLEDLHASPEEIIALLRSYLASPARSDAAPAFRVHLRLARLLAARGDTAGATRERQLAQTLAPGANLPPAEASVSRQVP